MDVVDFAKQILAMQDQIDYQRNEIIRLMGYEQKYNELLDSSLGHSKAIVGGILTLCLKPGVMEALGQHHD